MPICPTKDEQKSWWSITGKGILQRDHFKRTCHVPTMNFQGICYCIYVSFQGGIWICCLVELSYGFYQGNIFCWQLLNRSICHSHKSSNDLHNFRETSDLNNGPLGKGNCEGKHHEVSSFYVRFLGIYI